MISLMFELEVEASNFYSILVQIISNHIIVQMEVVAKVCFAHCSTSRLALGSPGCCSVVRSYVTMPEIPYKPL